MTTNVTAEPAGTDDAEVDVEADLIDARVAELERQPAPTSPPKRESWLRRSATGAILTGLAMGFQEALEPRREEPSIMMETSGEPPTDLPVDAEVGQIRPADNVVTIRPWLFREEDATDRTATDGTSADDTGADPGTEKPSRP